MSINKRTLHEAIEKLEQAKERIEDLILESNEDDSTDYNEIEQLNNYIESIQSVIDEISDDYNLNEDSESKYLNAQNRANRAEQTEW